VGIPERASPTLFSSFLFPFLLEGQREKGLDNPNDKLDNKKDKLDNISRSFSDENAG